MKHLKAFEDLESAKSPEQLVYEFSEKYPEYANFFKEFIHKFPDKQSFQETLADYLQDNQEEEDIEEDEDKDYSETTEEFIERNWDPDSEIYMLEQEFNVTDIDTEMWCDFYNEIEDTWEISMKRKKYNV